jgi:SNF2 family DNA or RNA helicase
VFENSGITAEVLSGDTGQLDRETMIADFQAGKYRVFIGTIAAAGEGIDGLQHVCDTMFFLDRSWSTIRNKQAEDRLHRGGTKNTVQIIDVMARRTLDWGRHQKLAKKWIAIKEILGDDTYHLQAEITQHYNTVTDEELLT